MPPSFQRHFSPVPLRHFYSVENVLDPPLSPLRRSYPLENPSASGPARKLPSAPAPTPRKLPEAGTKNANVFQLGQLARLSSSGELTALPTPSTSNPGESTVPGSVQQRLGVDAPTLRLVQVRSGVRVELSHSAELSIDLYIQEQSKIKLKPR